MERRHLLRTTGIALVAGLAGCTGNGDGNGGNETTEPDGGMDGETPTDDEMDGETTESDDGMDDETPTDGEMSAEISGAQLAIDNVGVSAWEVTQDGTGSVAETGAENPTMTFEVGQRYAVENRGWSTHPFALRASDDTPLLSQSADGEFEGDADVDWVDNGETLSFTVTEDLAANLNYYICTIHSSMRGDVEAA